MTFEEFASDRTPSLLRYATVLTCDRHLAEDLVQEVLVRTFRKWKRIEGPSGDMEPRPVDINGAAGRLWVETGARPSSPKIVIEWLPADRDKLTLTIDVVPDGEAVALRIARSVRPDGKRVSAQVSPHKPRSAGTPVTVRGMQGTYIDGSRDNGVLSEVRVELGGGLWLEVSGPLGQADLVKIAGTLKISQDAKFPWLGKRWSPRAAGRPGR